MNENFTPSQKEAITSEEKNIVVFAGAGSGKTRVLTERYKNILNNMDVHPANVLAITFTNQATEEMKKRIDYLPDAEITTFHSLAVKILREQAIEMGVHPQFTILDENMAKVALWKIINKLLFKSTLKENYQTEDLLDIMLQIIAKGLTIDEVNKVTRKAHGQNNTQINLIKTKVYSLFTDLEKMITSLKVGSKTKEKAQFLLNSKQEILLLIDKLLGVGTEKEWLKLTSYFNEVKRLQSPIKETVDDLKDQLNNFLLIAYEEKDLPELENVISFLLKVEEKYVAFKAKNQLLDFWELEKQMLFLLSTKPEIKEYYQQKYTHILVDEFQDTSRLQKKILSLLAKENLFLVGDPGQAIYGFREGNPELDNFENLDFHSVFLKENFRSHQQILEFINSTFQNLNGNYFNKLIPGDMANNQGGVRLVQLDKGRNKREEIIAEAKAIAQIIKKEEIGQCTILLQTSTHVTTYLQVLKDNGILCKNIGEQNFFSSPTVWALNSLLKLTLQPANQLVWYEVLQSFFSLSNRELNMT